MQKIIRIDDLVIVTLDSGDTYQKNGITDEEFNVILNAKSEDDIVEIFFPKIKEVKEEIDNIKLLEDRVRKSNLLEWKNDAIYFPLVSGLSMPKELCYLEGSDFNDYMYDMDLCQKFATENRFEIARRITNYLGLNIDELDKFETIHNYINMNDKILRKGSISAYDNEIVLIPMNMRDGCIIAKGKSNSDYNYSAPHGAGRVMSRGEAFRTLTVEDFKKSMDGIYTTTADETTLDESPFVYKPMQSILNNIKDTVDVLEIIKPVYNFKAAEQEDQNMDYRKVLESREYDFLRNDPLLKDNILFLTVAGSHK